jgi:hypothetical protein
VDIYVSHEASSEGSGTLSDPYKTLSSAFSHSSDQKKIQIHLTPGVYVVENDLEFPNKYAVVIEGNGSRLLFRNKITIRTPRTHSTSHVALRDLVFDGVENLVEGCSSDTCSGCFNWE